MIRLIGDFHLGAQSTIPGKTGRTPIKKGAISNAAVLSEAYADPKPCSFSRGMRIDLNDLTILLISGTFSSDEHGNTDHQACRNQPETVKRSVRLCEAELLFASVADSTEGRYDSARLWNREH